MRNPNGFGSVVRLSGNRRKPYMARVTTGYRDNGQPIYKALDYFTRREDALICLANFNDQQFDLDYRNLTFAELFGKLKELEFPKLGTSLQTSLTSAYGHCGRLYKLRYRAIRKHQMQGCIDNCGKSYATQASIKNLFFHMDKLAFDLDIVEKRCSDTIIIKKGEAKERTPFTDDEVKKLWAHRNETADMALFMLYTGCRMREMLLMRCADIHLEKGYMTGGVKTESGKNRVIPIHPELRPVIEQHLSREERLFPLAVKSDGDIHAAQRSSFTRRWTALMEELGMKHTTHECRHTFRSKLDSAGANKVAIDLIMGHKSGDIGERVYTHKTLSELQAAVRKLSYGLAR